MNRLLFTIPIAVAALVASSACSFAEDEKPKAPERPAAANNPGERLKVLTEKLSLTEEQQGKIRTIIETHAPKFKELRKDTALSQEDKRAKMLELRKAEFQEIRAVLTPEQQEKMKELRKDKAPKADK